MKCSRDDFFWAAHQNIISVDQAKTLWDALENRRLSSGAPKFDIANVLYYAGAVVVILAMGWFVGANASALGKVGVMGVLSLYTLLFSVVGAHLWHKTSDLKTPGGLLVTLATCLVPCLTALAIDLAGFTHLDSMWQFWCTVVCTTLLLASLGALYFIRFPFLMAPLSFALYSLIQINVPETTSFEARCGVSIFYGILMLAAAYAVDIQRTNQRRDFGFWLYFFSTISIFGGMMCVQKTETMEFFCFLGYATMMLLSVLLQRHVLLVFGGIGVITYLFHLSWNTFHNSPLFPLVLIVYGLCTIAAGIVIQKNRAQLRDSILGVVPAGLRDYLPQR